MKTSIFPTNAAEAIHMAIEDVYHEHEYSGQIGLGTNEDYAYAIDMKAGKQSVRLMVHTNLQRSQFVNVRIYVGEDDIVGSSSFNMDHMSMDFIVESSLRWFKEALNELEGYRRPAYH